MEFFGTLFIQLVWLSLQQLFTSVSVNNYSIIRLRLSDYRYKYTGDYFKKEKKKTFQCEIIFTYSGKTTTGSDFVRRGDYRLIIRDSEPMRARDFV